jgi:transposase
VDYRYGSRLIFDYWNQYSTGQFFAIEASHSDSVTYQAFLDEDSKSVSFQRATNVLIMDNASWHRRKTTDWHGWQPKYLPSYSPDLNPIERIWLKMKAEWFNKQTRHLSAQKQGAHQQPQMRIKHLFYPHCFCILRPSVK